MSESYRPRQGQGKVEERTGKPAIEGDSPVFEAQT